ncbi:hypothetical protein LCX93_11055 [Sulfurimonas sp. SWIR-19]|uniref:hypothetical protein n=1 Tax=Sulfurimonas sp. SWIR-19 TaxID=2878390 RepID=UPI001CF4033D|nr:hypothetical protein [Sulfurimonas sp. SWIR-19]UCN00053.1 hypothetical protein LCX93_11055 [Sulfurimonas sp. SWIR-19]
MKKILFISFLLSSLSASFLYDKDTPICIEDYYIKNSRVYFLKSSDGQWSSTRENNTIKDLHSGYTWDADNSICKPESWLILGMDVKDWHFLEALTGLLFGFTFMFFTIILFMQAGKEK